MALAGLVVVRGGRRIVAALEVRRLLRAEGVPRTDDVRPAGEVGEEVGEVGEDVEHLGGVAAGAEDDQEMCRIARAGRRFRAEWGCLWFRPLDDPEDAHEDESAEEEGGDGEDEEDLDAAVVSFGVVLLEVFGVMGDDGALGGGAEDAVHLG